MDLPVPNQDVLEALYERKRECVAKIPRPSCGTTGRAVTCTFIAEAVEGLLRNGLT
jgi:hypothetical protein